MVQTLAILTLLGLVIAGCATNPQGSSSTTSSAVLIFPSGEPKCPFEVLGPVSIEVQGNLADYNHGNTSRYHSQLEKEVRLRGGHAVVELQVMDAGMDQLVLAGTVIRFTDPNCHQ